VQSGPADQFDGASAQVKITGQDCFNVLLVGGLLHRVVQLNDPAEFIAAAIFSVGKNELRVVLSGHEFRLRLHWHHNCEPEHKKLAKTPESPGI